MPTITITFARILAIRHDAPSDIVGVHEAIICISVVPQRLATVQLWKSQWRIVVALVSCSVEMDDVCRLIDSVTSDLTVLMVLTKKRLIVKVRCT